MNEPIGVDSAFEIEVIQSASLRALIEKFGKENVKLAWGLGYLSGKSNGLAHALEVMK